MYHGLLKDISSSPDYSDISGDVFYDAGPLKASDLLKDLQFYMAQPLNNAPPVWLLNTMDM